MVDGEWLVRMTRSPRLGVSLGVAGPKKELRMWKYATDMQKSSHDFKGFDTASHLSEDVVDCIKWQATRGPSEVIEQREEMLVALERAGETMRETGHVEEWFSDCDPHVRKLCHEVNGPLLETLAKASGYGDAECVELLRRGDCILYRS